MARIIGRCQYALKAVAVVIMHCISKYPLGWYYCSSTRSREQSMATGDVQGGWLTAFGSTPPGIEIPGP